MAENEKIHVICIKRGQNAYYYNVVAPLSASITDIGNQLANDETMPEFVRAKAFQYNFTCITTTIEPFPDCVKMFDNSEYRKILS